MKIKNYSIKRWFIVFCLCFVGSWYIVIPNYVADKFTFADALVPSLKSWNTFYSKYEIIFPLWFAGGIVLLVLLIILFVYLLKQYNKNLEKDTRYTFL